MKTIRVTGVLLALGMIVSSIALAAPTMASTAQNISMTFAEGVPNQFGCTNPFGYCGTGEVVPLGKATEMIEFGQGCGGTCDLRVISLASGSLSLNEHFSSPNCPGNCYSHGVGRPFSGALSDTIVGGTGAFAGASGNVVGTVKGAGGSTQIKLSGSLILP